MRFEQQARERLAAQQHRPLVDGAALGRDAALAVPAPGHYLPLLDVIATRQAGEPVSFPVEGIDGGSVSMLTVQVG